VLQEAGYVRKDVCTLLLVLLTGFLSPVACRLSAGSLGPSLGHLNYANCALLHGCSESCNSCPAQAAKLGPKRRLLEKASLFFTWNTLSWRGATATPVPEGPVKVREAQGSAGGYRASGTWQQMQLQLVWADESQKLLCQRQRWSR